MGCGPCSPGGWREGGGCGFSSWAGLGEGQGRRGRVEGVHSGAGQCPCALMNSTVAENLRTCVSTSQNTHQPLPAAWEAVIRHSCVTSEFIFWHFLGTRRRALAMSLALCQVASLSQIRSPGTVAIWSRTDLCHGAILDMAKCSAASGPSRWIPEASPGSVTSKVSPDMLSVPWGAEWSPLGATGLQQWVQQRPCCLYGAASLWGGQRRK